MLPKVNIVFHGQSKSFKHWQNTWDTHGKPPSVSERVHTHTHLAHPHTRRSHLSVALARADSNASNQLVQAVWLCVAPPGSIICNAYATLISAPPFPLPPLCSSLLQLLRFVLNVVLLKTNLLPIIKIRAKQTAKRKARNSRKKPEKNKVKFHKSFCGNRWKSSKNCLHIRMCVCACVCVVFVLVHNLSQIALKRWHKVCQLCVTISANCPRYVCHLCVCLLIPDAEAR